MDWTTLLASLSGSVDEDRLRRNQQPAPHRHARGFASAIGNVISGATKSLKGFGAALLKVVGDTMVSLGSALIALGVARAAAMTFNPAAAIAAGAALIAFGTALSNAASAIANPVGSSAGGGISAPIGGRTIWRTGG